MDSSSFFWVPWQPGPLEHFDGPVLVSLTDFRYQSPEDHQEANQIGLELRNTWPVMHGAVGLWLWTATAAPRSGSLSVWRDPDDLRRFVRWPVHTAIMSAWRDRGTLESETWSLDRLGEPASPIAEAERILGRSQPL